MKHNLLKSVFVVLMCAFVTLIFSCSKVNYQGRPIGILNTPVQSQGFQLKNNSFIMTEGEVREHQIEFVEAISKTTTFNWTIVSKNPSINVNDRFKTLNGVTTGQAGSKFVVVRVAAVDVDNIQQGTQEFQINLVPQGTQSTLPSNLTLLDAHKLPMLRFQQDTISIKQEDIHGEHVLVLSETSQVPVVIDIETQDGTARRNDRYIPFKKQLVIPPGSKEIPVPIELIEQYHCRIEQDFKVVVRRLSGASMAQRVGNIIILEDHALCNPPPPPPPPPIDIEKNQKFVMSEGERRAFGVKFINVHHDVTFNWTLKPLQPVNLGDRFKVYSGTSSMRAGDRLLRIDVTAVDVDNFRQGDQEFEIVMTLAGTNADFTAGLTLLDKYKEPRLKYAVNPIVIVNRADGTAKIVMNETSALAISFNIDTQDGSAYAGVDYRPITANRIVIPAGQRSAVVPLNLIPQTECKRDLHFYLAVSNIENATMAEPRAEVVIPKDRELCKPLPKVRYDKDPITIKHGDTGYARLVMNEPSRKDVVIDIETQDGSAKAGTDYEGVKMQITIPAGTTSIDVPIRIYPQTVCKPEMNFSLVVTNLTNATMDRRRATIVIPRDRELCKPPKPPPPIPQPASGGIDF